MCTLKHIFERPRDVRGIARAIFALFFWLNDDVIPPTPRS